MRPVRTKLAILAPFIPGLIGVAALLSLSPAPELPQFRLSDGAEFRVIQITYTSGPTDSAEHNIGSAPKAAFWLWRHLPEAVQRHVPYPETGIGDTGCSRPALSIWWARFDATTREPILGPAGDVLMTLDSGRQINLGWPSPADPGYRQIFVTDPPRDSKRLAFEVPVEQERVRFEIDNPAYR